MSPKTLAYQDEIHSLACEIAAIEHGGQEYEALPSNIQAEVHADAVRIYGETLRETAEHIRRTNEARRQQ